MLCVHCDTVFRYEGPGDRNECRQRMVEHELQCDRSPIVLQLRKRERDFDALLSTLVGLRDRAQAAEAELAKLRSVTPTAPTGAGAKS